VLHFSKLGTPLVTCVEQVAYLIFSASQKSPFLVSFCSVFVHIPYQEIVKGGLTEDVKQRPHAVHLQLAQLLCFNVMKISPALTQRIDFIKFDLQALAAYTAKLPKYAALIMWHAIYKYGPRQFIKPETHTAFVAHKTALFG